MDPDLFNAVIGIAGALYFVAVLITLGRMIAGPNSLDRLVGLDSITAMLQCTLAAYMAWRLDTTVVYAMLVIALLGFLSSLAVAKFRVPDEHRDPEEITSDYALSEYTHDPQVAELSVDNATTAATIELTAERLENQQ